MATIRQWLDRIDEALHSGELLTAFDLAERALEEFPEDPLIRYKSVLILARAGATHQARSSYQRFALGEGTFPQQDPSFELDVAALEARLAKDEALAAPPELRRTLLVAAAKSYEDIYLKTGNYYPGINAAT